MTFEVQINKEHFATKGMLQTLHGAHLCVKMTHFFLVFKCGRVSCISLAASGRSQQGGFLSSVRLSFPSNPALPSSADMQISWGACPHRPPPHLQSLSEQV